VKHPDYLLARRMLKGRDDAFDEFFEGFYPGLRRFALVRMHNHADDAEEVVQTTLCAAISKLKTYRGEAPLFTWLCTFCRHEISAFYRKRHRQPPTVNLVEDAPEMQATLDSLWAIDPDGPDRSLERQEIARLVHVTLDRLPGRYRDVLEWKYADDLPVKEIASRMELSPKAAESLLTRARVAFRDGFGALVRGTSYQRGSEELL
jgi:RNA polymerase sigma-70 factor (ECF subfamily)